MNIAEYIIESEKVILREVLQRMLISYITKEHERETLTREEITALMLPRKIRSLKHDRKTKTIVIEYE